MRADALQRRQRIITAATALLTTRHPMSLSLEEVAKEARVGIATLYRNFNDRAELFHACAATLFKQVIELQTRIVAQLPADPSAAWSAYISGLMDLSLGALIPVLAPARLGQLPEDLQAQRETAASQVAEIITAARRAGIIHPQVEPEFFFIGLITVSRPQVDAVAELAPDLSKSLVRIYLSGLRHGPENFPL